MPNWCEGELRVRGPLQNLLNFFQYGLCLTDHTHCTKPFKLFPVRIDTSCFGPDDEIYITIRDTCWVKGSSRAFVDNDEITIYKHKIDPETEQDIYYATIPTIRQAWSFEADTYLELARTFGVDIKIWGAMCYQEFEQEIVIEKGELIRNEEHDYDDWVWESRFPTNGY